MKATDRLLGRKVLRIDFIIERQHCSGHGNREDARGVGHKKARYGQWRLATGCPGRYQLLQPGRLQPHAGIGGGDDRAWCGADRHVAPPADIGARLHKHAEVGSCSGKRVANARMMATVLSWLPPSQTTTSSGRRVCAKENELRPHAGLLVVYGDNDGNLHRCIMPQGKGFGQIAWTCYNGGGTWGS